MIMVRHNNDLTIGEYYWVRSIKSNHHWDYITDWKLYRCTGDQASRKLVPDGSESSCIWANETVNYFEGFMEAILIEKPASVARAD